MQFSFSSLEGVARLGFGSNSLTLRWDGAHLQDEAEVRRGLVLAPEVFPEVDVQVVELDEADEIPGRLEIEIKPHVSTRSPPCSLTPPLCPR